MKAFLIPAALFAAAVQSLPSSTQAQAGNWKYLGVSESVAEFGSGTYPGVYGKDFYFPDTSTIDTLMSDGFNIFRLAFAMERMATSSLSGALNSAYLANLTAVAKHITGKGGYAVLDPHNFGRYNGAIITDTTAFKTFWANLAGTFKSDSKIIFDTNNEYHDMDETLVLNLNQAAITGIRGAGATTQTIFVEGNSYSSAAQWATVSDNLKGLTDPNNNLVYEMHLYLDSDSSGTHEECVSATIGVERATAATNWLKQNKKLGVIGEFAGGANSQCMSAVTGLLAHLKQNSDVWTGALWWAAGPWWANYMYSMEPPSGTAYTYYKSTLVGYKP